MRVGIVGAGALGTLFGYRLAVHAAVTLLEIDPAVVEAVRRDGLRRDGLRLEGAPARRVTIGDAAREVFDVEALFVFVRPTDTLRALRPFVGNLDPACAIVSLQNGLGNEDALRATLGSSIALIVGVTTASALRLGPGLVRPLGAGTTILGPAGASPQTCGRVAQLLVDAGMPATLAYDIRSQVWGKLIATAAINPVAALLGHFIDTNGIDAVYRACACLPPIGLIAAFLPLALRRAPA